MAKGERNLVNFSGATGMVLLWLGSVLPLCLGVVYTNDWAVRITGGPETAETILKKYGFVHMGQVSLP